MVAPSAADFGAVFASPKSSTFTPSRVIMMSPGFKSRCTTPLRCVRSTASAICIAYFSVDRAEEAALELVEERLAFEVIHHHEVDAILFADIVERADVWMIQRRDPREPPVRIVHADPRGRSTLIATVRSRRVSRALYTSPMPPAPSGARVSYGPKRTPSASGMIGRLSPSTQNEFTRKTIQRVPASSPITLCQSVITLTVASSRSCRAFTRKRFPSG